MMKMTEFEEAVYREWAAEQEDGEDTSLAAYADHLAGEAEARDEDAVWRAGCGPRS